MVSLRFRTAACASFVLVALLPASAADLGQYREFRLGQSLATVTSLAQTAPRDLATLHERPALLQEISWQPRYDVRRIGDFDSIQKLTFGFVNDRLFSIQVEYDRGHTEGLTGPDMVTSLTAIYGTPVPATRSEPRRSPYAALDTPSVLAEWIDDDARVVLRHSTYSGAFSLVVSSTALAQEARTAQAAAVTLDVREAPAREAARVKAEAQARREAEEKTRTTNKSRFEP